MSGDTFMQRFKSLAQQNGESATVRGRRFGIALALVVMMILPFVIPSFYVSVTNYIGIYSLVCLGLVLLTGVGGLTSFGQAAFVGIGAYTSAYLTTVHGFDPWLTLPVGFVLTGLSAWLIGSLTLLLSGHYLSLATLAWGISIYYLFGNVEFLGGHSGISNISGLEVFGLELTDNRFFFILIWVLVLVNVLFLLNLLDSRPGRAIRALKNGVVMAESCGVNTAWYKLAIFIYAALLASLAGWLYAHMQRFINPTPFGINMGIEFLFMVVVGGAGYVWGALFGALIITVSKEWLKDLLPLLFGQSGNYEVIVFGILILVVLYVARAGLWPLLCARLPKWSAVSRTLMPAEQLLRREQPSRGTSLLDVDGVCKKFGGLVAVNNMRFSVNAGEIVGLLGPNGAGKSTMFNLISGVLPVSDGQHFLERRHPLGDLIAKPRENQRDLKPVFRVLEER